MLVVTPPAFPKNGPYSSSSSSSSSWVALRDIATTIQNKAKRDYNECIQGLYQTWKTYARGPRGDKWQMFARREQKASYHWEKYSKPTYATVAALQPEDVVQKLITRKEDRVKTDPQSLLSPDIMLHLLKFFDKPEMCRMSCVSKKWRTFCGQKLLTKGIWNLKRHKEMLDGTAISYLIPKLQGVRELNLFRCKLSAANLSLLLYKCTALRKLDLSYTVCDHEESPGGGDDAKEQHTVSSPSSSSTSTRDGASSSIMTGRRKGRNRPTSSRSRMEEEKDEKQQHIGNDNGNDDVKEGA